MDQPKIERMLRLMQLLSSNVNYTLDELSSRLELSKRTLFRYIDTFKSAGFVVQRVGEGTYKLTTLDKELTDISQLVYFSEEEAVVVSHLIENLEGTNALKAGLRQKLAAVYDSTSFADYIDNKGKAELVETLAKAIKEKRQVELISYASAHSGENKDYLIEPYKFTKDYVDVIAFDARDMKNKTFKISRMGEVRLLDGWRHESSHEERPIDAFRMSGSPIEHVRLSLTLRAKNLLSEEYPVTGVQITQEKRSWYWEGDVNSLEGVGRFVLGLPDEVNVEEGSLLKEWLQQKGALVQEKFR